MRYKSHTPDPVLHLKLTWWLVVLITTNTRYQYGTNPRIADTHFQKEIGEWTLICQCLLTEWHLLLPHFISLAQTVFIASGVIIFLWIQVGEMGNVQVLRWLSRNYWSGKPSWQDTQPWISSSSAPQTRWQLWMELTPSSWHPLHTKSLEHTP